MPEFSPSKPEIQVYEGELVEGEVVELFVNFSGDFNSNLHPIKKWTVFSEREVKHNDNIDEYYFEEGRGEVFTAEQQDNIQITKLTPGRLFCRFEYTDIFGIERQIRKVFVVFPKRNINFSSELTKGDVGTFTADLSVSNVNVVWSFQDDNSVISGATVQKEFDVDGYHTFYTLYDFSDSTYNDGNHIVWASEPDDQLAFISTGIFGNGLPIDPSKNDGSSLGNVIKDVVSLTENVSGQSGLEAISGKMLVRANLDELMDLDITFSKSVDNLTNAPLQIVFTDNSTYNIPVANEGDDRIEYTEIDFGDGEIIRNTEINQTFTKLYKKSGLYNGKYRVFTKHERSGGPDYTQIKEFDFDVKVDPFFSKWFVDHFQQNIYNSDGFKDLADSWGIQMDRLYNETQSLIDSIDVEKIDDSFIQHYAETYGDFSDIYEKIGFSGFVKDMSDRFNQFVDYNFFDRLKEGSLFVKEKQEFINYIQSSKERLRLKGTPVSIERAIANFFLDAKVVELWTDSFVPSTEEKFTDEVFGGVNDKNNTGLKLRVHSTPIADNQDNIVINSKANSYIEVNTFNRNEIQFYTESSKTVIKDGVEYVVFDKT